MTKLILALCLLAASCSSTTYYIVRHAEKQNATTMTTDVPLSEKGMARAQALAELLRNAGIKHIYTTNFQRTRATVQPLASAIGVTLEVYDPRDKDFPERLKKIKGNVLVAGHSNTVDDLVNELSGENFVQGDLPDSAYGDLFVLIRRGKKWTIEKRHFGE